VVALPVEEGLHLKSALTQIDERHFLVEDGAAARRMWAGLLAAEPEAVPIWVEESHGANALRVGDALLHLANRPRLREALERLELGLELVALDMSELEKADGGLTCLSILLPREPRP
jgi:dimethylargininase